MMGEKEKRRDHGEERGDELSFLFVREMLMFGYFIFFARTLHPVARAV